MANVPDLVRDAKLLTPRCDGRVTVHELQDIAARPGHRPVPRRETWERDQVALGRGGFGTVWLERRRDRPDQRPSVFRAVKQIDFNRRVDMSGYLRELEAIMKFSHAKYNRCFVKSSGWFERDQSLFIAMEYLQYGDLYSYLQSSRKPLKEKEAKTIAFQLTEGLCFLHSEGFAHRDVKPSNILIACLPPAWWVKLGDFGLSKRLQSSNDPTSIVGTPGFMAPEVLGLIRYSEGSYMDPLAADMWALGETIFQLVTKTKAFQDNAGLGRYVHDPTLFPVGVLRRQKISFEGIEFIQSSMAPKPGMRRPAVVALEHAWINDQAPYNIQSAWPLDATRSAATQDLPVRTKPPTPAGQRPPRPANNLQRRPQRPSGPLSSILEVSPSNEWTPLSQQSSAAAPNNDQIPRKPLPIRPIYLDSPPAVPRLARQPVASSPPPTSQVSTSSYGSEPTSSNVFSAESTPAQPVREFGISPDRGPAPARLSPRKLTPKEKPEATTWKKRNSLLGALGFSKSAYASSFSRVVGHGSDKTVELEVRVLKQEVTQGSSDTDGRARLVKQGKSDDSLTGYGSVVRAARYADSTGGRLTRAPGLYSTPAIAAKPERRSAPTLKKIQSNASLVSVLTGDSTFALASSEKRQLARILVSGRGDVLMMLSRPDRMTLWETLSGEKVGSTTLDPLNPTSAILSKSGDLLLFSGLDNVMIHVWKMKGLKKSFTTTCQVPKPTEMAEFGCRRSVLALSPRENILAVMHLWHKKQAFVEEMKTFVTFFDMLTHQAIGTVAIPATVNMGRAAGQVNTEHLQNPNVAPYVYPTSDSPDHFFTSVFTPDEKSLILTVQREVFLVSVSARSVTQVLSDSRNWLVRAFPFSQGRLTFAAIAEDGQRQPTRLRLWCTSTASHTRTLHHPSAIIGFDFSPDTSLLIVALANRLLVLWDVATSTPLFRASVDTSVTFHHPLAFSPCGQYFVTYHTDACRLWKVPSNDIARLRSAGADPDMWGLLGCRGEVGQVVFDSTDASVTRDILSELGSIPDEWPRNENDGPRTQVEEPTPLPGSLQIPVSPVPMLATAPSEPRIGRRGLFRQRAP